MYNGYPPSWDDVEEDEHRPPSVRFPCLDHQWADTGMKWTYCKICNEEGEWTMDEGYRISRRPPARKD